MADPTCAAGWLLLAKGEVFERQLRAGAEGGTQRSKEAHEQGGHGWIMHEGRKSQSDRSSIVVTVGKMAARMTTWRRTALLAKASQDVRDLLARL